MNAVRLALAGVVVLGLACVVRADDKKDSKKADDVKTKVVGTWQVESDGKGLPKGSKLQFAKDGKIVVTAKRDEEERKVEGTYKVDGTTIKVTMKRNDKERTQEIKVTSIDDKKLVLEGPKGESITLKKVVEKKDK
jgi:uncharacterized protein (TIGR03066 family)